MAATAQVDIRIVGVALHAVVASVVVRVPVAVVLAIRLVVAMHVADGVAQREAVVRRDEVDAGPRPAAGGLENIGRAVDAPRELSVLVLVFQKDLGTSLLYFGMFVVTLYVATERVSWLIIGLLLFFGGAFLAYHLGNIVGGPFANFYQRANIWLDPFSDPYADGYQLVQGLLGLGTGGLFGAGPGGGQPHPSRHHRPDDRRHGEGAFMTVGTGPATKPSPNAAPTSPYAWARALGSVTSTM